MNVVRALRVYCYALWTYKCASNIYRLDESISSQVSFGDNSKVPVKGKGKILIHLKNGDHQFISDFYYVPNMKNNILSIGQLLEKGYTFFMKDRNLMMRNHSNKLITKVEMSKNRMFMLNIQNEEVKCLSACMKDPRWLWHMRFGHVNFGSLKFLSSKGMVNGLPHIDHPNELCEGCVLGKHSRSSFPKKASYRARRSLELIHTDVCGPIKPMSFGKHHYFITFIDDYTQKTWVYFLKKSQRCLALSKYSSLILKSKAATSSNR